MLIEAGEAVPPLVMERLGSARSVVVLTGAGVSAESGVPTFRGEQGLWKQYRPEQLATPEAFARDPDLVWEWYNWRRELVSRCEPNAAHEAVARMETLFPAFLLVTQNVDGLHRRAGSRKLVEVHGHLFSKRCVRDARHVQEYPPEATEPRPRCDECGAYARPHIVWFGEHLDMSLIERVAEAIAVCDVLIVIGTSGLVYPVAAFPGIAHRAGAFVINVNPDSTGIDEDSSVLLRGKASERVPSLLP